MPTPEAVVAHYEAQQRQAEAAAILSRRLWRQVGEDFDTDWAKIINRLSLIVGSAQLGAARAGIAYIAAALEQIGQEAEPAAAIRPAGWVGVASDGRALDSLLYSAVVHSKAAVGAGADLKEALLVGQQDLEMLVRTQVADAGRGAAGVAIATRPKVGWTRMVSPPCCQRCAALAGKFFKWNVGFQRHPFCNCRHVPCGEQGFENYTADIMPGQIRDLTQAQRQAIDDGADMNQVINAHRKGARSRDGMTTSEGATRRGYASRVKREAARQRGEVAQERTERGSGKRNVRRVQGRLTPEAIYRVSATREEALRLLAKNGYIVGDIRKIAA